MPAILAETVSVAQSLNMHLEAGLQGLCSVPATITYVKRACWVLFCIDRAYAMRWRTFSVGENSSCVNGHHVTPEFMLIALVLS
jgi:hypothetical protein